MMSGVNERPAVCLVQQGQCCWDLPGETPPSPGQPMACLKQREVDIIRLVVLGYKSTEIAVLLGLRPATVQSYRCSIRNKLHMRRRSELVRFALESRLVESSGVEATMPGFLDSSQGLPCWF